MSDKNKWDRLPTETTKAYSAFVEFLEAGPQRSLRDVSVSSYGVVKNWAGFHNWTERVTAWDDQVQCGKLDRYKQTVQGARSMIAAQIEDLVNVMIKIAKGHMVPNRGQVTALQVLFNRIGLNEIKDNETSSNVPVVQFVLEAQLNEVHEQVHEHEEV
jgi:hypothetical protein